eukprot:4308559-Ditylum_brightwellii.AAC.1
MQHCNGPRFATDQVLCSAFGIAWPQHDGPVLETKEPIVPRSVLVTPKSQSVSVAQIVDIGNDPFSRFVVKGKKALVGNETGFGDLLKSHEMVDQQRFLASLEKGIGLGISDPK